jgi:hypothetical protein
MSTRSNAVVEQCPVRIRSIQHVIHHIYRRRAQRSTHVLSSTDGRQFKQWFLTPFLLPGTIEIAKTMGPWGMLPLLMIPLVLVNKGDFIGAREAVSHIDNEADRSMIVNFVDEYQRKSNSPNKSGQYGAKLRTIPYYSVLHFLRLSRASTVHATLFCGATWEWLGQSG